jgi:thiamine-triphosphatase
MSQLNSKLKESRLITTLLQNTRVYQPTGPRLAKITPILEVERKFMPTSASITRLRKNHGHPAFTSHIYLGRKVLKDIYLDTLYTPTTSESQFMRNGIYIRMRNGALEAKIRQSGDWTNTTSHEIAGKHALDALVARTFPDTPVTFGDLSPIAWMRTLRDEWEIEGFNVAIDHTLFGDWMQGMPKYPQKPHVVGEVELCQGAGEDVAAEDMERRIEMFVEKYGWAFSKGEGKVVGKLVGFDEWVAKRSGK